MRNRIEFLRGNDISARVARGAGWTAIGFLASQLIRLILNLILTRLLFPEAFGLMALVQVFMVGLVMFSDAGISQSIMQHSRGDDPKFLNAAWTVQIIRGICLWLGACALALPAANFYNEPRLAQLLPAAALVFLITGLNPTRIDTASRHLVVRPVVFVDVAAQLCGGFTMIVLAWATQSVWALVGGAIVGASAKATLAYIFLPGPANRIVLDLKIFRQLLEFGKWIFLSTIVGFIAIQGDRAILGKYLSLEQLGIYSIGHFLATAPALLAGAIVSRVFIPLHRENSVDSSAQNEGKIRRMRFIITGCVILLTLAIALVGNTLVALLYDSRYAAAGAIVVAIACSQMFHLIGITYDQAALAAGDARGFFVVCASRSVVQIVFFIVGMEIYGIWGALVGQGIAFFFSYPALVWLAAKHKAWDPRHDVAYILFSIIAVGLALSYNGALIRGLSAFVRE